MAGHRVGIPYGAAPETWPASALERWLAEAEITEGPDFRAVRQNGRVRAEAIAPDSVA